MRSADTALFDRLGDALVRIRERLHGHLLPWKRDSLGASGTVEFPDQDAEIARRFGVADEVTLSFLLLSGERLEEKRGMVQSRAAHDGSEP